MKRPGRLLVLGLITFWVCGCDGWRRGSWDRDGDGVVRLAVLGDSNSFSLFPDNWVRRLRTHLETVAPGQWEVRSYGRPNARITAYSPTPILSGAHQVAQALAVSPPPEVVVLAFGTNDRREGVPNADIVEAYRAAIQAFAPCGARVRLATTPWCGDPRCDGVEIADLNARLRAAWPRGVLIDFDSWVTPDHLLADRVHFNAVGHGKRLEAVLSELF